jgi:hypothetical protein
MKTRGEKLIKSFRSTAKLGMLALGMFAVLCIPHIVLAAHGQAHSNHIRAFSHSMGHLAEKERRTNEQVKNTIEKTDPNTHILIASEEKNVLPCPQKNDEADNESSLD